MFNWQSLKDFIKGRFDLTSDSAQQSVVVENISKGVEFSGTNLWILIFATFVASLGLNVNSAAVIIGAMLISPLMGPIMGIGLSVGINNFELLKRSLRNFGLMIAVSLVASTLYFMLSPINHAQSELLARTTPTTYDVLIAFFGGLAGIVAQTRSERISTVVPGVAIATALMPPLCTAGFGLATGNAAYFFGAFYLFFINTVFIAFATYFIVRFLKYSPKVFLDKEREKKVKRYMVIILFCTFVPSVLLAYRIIDRTNFENDADKYVSSVFNFNNTIVVDASKRYHVDGNRSQIELVLVGQPLSEQVMESARKRMAEFGLKRTDLIITQADSVGKADMTMLNNNIATMLTEKNSRISELESRLLSFEVDSIAAPEIAREANVIVDNIGTLSLNRDIAYNANGVAVDTSVVCIVTPMDRNEPISREKLIQWLQVRLRQDKVMVYIDK